MPITRSATRAAETPDVAAPKVRPPRGAFVCVEHRPTTLVQETKPRTPRKRTRLEYEAEIARLTREVDYLKSRFEDYHSNFIARLRAIAEGYTPSGGTEQPVEAAPVIDMGAEQPPEIGQ